MSHPIATTYAKALSDIFTTKGEKANFSAFIKSFKEWNLALSDPALNSFFISHKVSIKEKKRALKKTFQTLGEKHHLLANFFCLLLDNKRWKQKQAILTCLQKKEYEVKGILPAEVESAKALTLEQKQKITQKLEKFFNKKVTLQINPPNSSLLGGLRVQAGGFVFDDTLAFHLKCMENQIKQNEATN